MREWPHDSRVVAAAPARPPPVGPPAAVSQREACSRSRSLAARIAGQASGSGVTPTADSKGQPKAADEDPGKGWAGQAGHAVAKAAGPEKPEAKAGAVQEGSKKDEGSECRSDAGSDGGKSVVDKINDSLRTFLNRGTAKAGAQKTCTCPPHASSLGLVSPCRRSKGRARRARLTDMPTPGGSGQQGALKG